MTFLVIPGLFNLRASDISYNPFFTSYAIVEHASVRLYIVDKNRKLTGNITDDMTNVTVADHLNTGDEGQCDTPSIGMCVEVFFIPSLPTLARNILRCARFTLI